MPHPGPEEGFDYTVVPYLPDWEPLQERKWALKFVNEDGPNDEMGFQQQLQVEVPFLFYSSAPSWVPTVDGFLRHDSKGRRRDLNYELARFEKPKEIEDKERREREERVQREWEEAQAALDKKSQPLEPKPSPEKSSGPPKGKERLDQKERVKKALEGDF
jgi:hypothetical protein